MKPFRLLVVCTHPVQYLAPWFRHLTGCNGLDILVWYVTLPDPVQQGTGFRNAFSWDVPLLEGYRWEHIGNRSSNPGLERFFGTRLGDIRRTLDKASPDAVLVTGWHQWSLIQVALSANRLRIPLLVRGESNDIGPRPAWKRALQRLFLQLFQGFLYIGKENREFYRSRGIPDSALHFCPYFVDNDRFIRTAKTTPEARTALRARWGVTPVDTVFLFVGKLQQKKHPDHLLHAFDTASRSQAGMALVFVGDGEMRASLEAAAQSNEERVHFAGFVNQSEIGRYYSAADCLVLPSDSGETWGLVVNEAMNHGLPVIISNRVGCVSDLVGGRGTGFVFPFGDTHALAENLSEIHGNCAMRREMGERARLVVSEYSMEIATSGLLQAIGRLAGEEGKGA